MKRSHENALGEVLWPLADHQGTVRDLAEYDAGTDTTTVVNHRTYDSFGHVTAETNAAVEHLFAYTGREWDADAELYNYRARWYDPQAGRFISEDPLGFDGGDVNLTRYVTNSPWNFTDPTGRIATSPLVQAATQIVTPVATNFVNTVTDWGGALGNWSGGSGDDGLNHAYDLAGGGNDIAFQAAVAATESDSFIGNLWIQMKSLARDWYEGARAVGSQLQSMVESAVSSFESTLQDLQGRLPGVMSFGGYEVANSRSAANERTVSIVAEGLNLNNSGEFLQMAARGAQLQQRARELRSKIEVQENFRQHREDLRQLMRWGQLAWVAEELGLTNKLPKLPKSSIQRRLEAKLALTVAQYDDLNDAFLKQFGNLESIGYSEGLSSDLHRNLDGGEGLQGAISALKMSMRQSPTGGLQKPALDPIEIATGAGVGGAKLGSALWGAFRGAGKNAPKSVAGVLDDSANFAQKTFSETFSKRGKFSGRTIDEVADLLRKGDLKPSDVPLEYFTRRNGQTLISNTRSAEALRRAGIPRSQWYGVDISGNIRALKRLAGQLDRNKLWPNGISNVRPSGGQ